ncbi:MAG: RNA methyltransferase, partial [Bacteroidetes bacterium]|nr:RNA methyltransferase [Bacteroidota bacterium]
NDPKDFERLENYFDVIVVDAPCSGSGLFRREPEAIQEWSEDNVALCSQRQQRIIADVWASLKENGILIYSTCSYSKKEDEDINDWIVDTLNAESIKLNANSEWNITEAISDKHGCYGYRFFPDKTLGEGFFIAAFRKTEGSEFIFPKLKKNTFEKLSKKEEAIAKEWLANNNDYSLLKKENSVYALPADHVNDLQFIQSSLYIKKAGILTGKLVHDELIPEHELAMSLIINDKIQAVDLSENNAINFLSKEEVNAGTSVKGWTLAKYNNHNLGWMKVLQNRVNNYYPSAWRILKRK